MRPSRLNRYWVRWRRYRRNALMAGGFEADLAWKIATGEAFARQRVSRARGRQAAIDAELVFEETDAVPRFYLRSPLMMLPVGASVLAQ